MKKHYRVQLRLTLKTPRLWHSMHKKLISAEVYNRLHVVVHLTLIALVYRDGCARYDIVFSRA